MTKRASKDIAKSIKMERRHQKLCERELLKMSLRETVTFTVKTLHSNSDIVSKQMKSF